MAPFKDFVPCGSIAGSGNRWDVGFIEPKSRKIREKKSNNIPEMVDPERRERTHTCSIPTSVQASTVSCIATTWICCNLPRTASACVRLSTRARVYVYAIMRHTPIVQGQRTFQQWNSGCLRNKNASWPLSFSDSHYTSEAWARLNPLMYVLCIIVCTIQIPYSTYIYNIHI